ncbi:LAMI_0G09692g1_1 [Lachancea mirantina]|uniref:Selenoprotein O n=1 Tax=Lachancea mirantina TaxID=1230905 RepID=A0A1G4KAK0_9SACH|nr:LAMI_0G09692g1_1 [Lachancea mirantina]
MPEARTILNVLKERSGTLFTHRLTADQFVPDVSRAVEIYERNITEERQRVFHTPRLVSKGAHFAYCIPERREHYRPLLTSQKALVDLQLNMDDELLSLINGTKVYSDKDKNIFPYSMAYAGFQFGQFAGQLGDGRVANLFEIDDAKGRPQTLQIKGSGITPFSRFADGKAVVRSSIREFIISESLHHIGIPSTRALQLTALPGTKAQRETSELCAVYCRFAPSWIRLGNFDLCRWRGDHDGLVKLTDFCIDTVFEQGKDFPEAIDLNVYKKDYFKNEDIGSETIELGPIEGTTKYELFFRHVVNLNAEAVACWQAYGFLNGVLNTDNTSIMGLAMDFGPFSFLDKFEPRYTPNHDDIQLRYSFANQPSAIWWNLTKFAQAMATLIGAGPKHIDKFTNQGELDEVDLSLGEELTERANRVIAHASHEFKFRFMVRYASLMAHRIGINLNLSNDLSNKDGCEQIAVKVSEFNSSILEPLLDILHVSQVDYNNFFVKLQGYNGPFLASGESQFEGVDPGFLKVFFSEAQEKKLVDHYHGVPVNDSGETRILIEKVHDLRKWIDHYLAFASNDPDERFSLASNVNPIFTPRNYIFDQVIEDLTSKQGENLGDAEKPLDLSLLNKLYLMSVNPYNPNKWDDSLRPEVVKGWITHGEETEKFMRQCSCSS